MLPGTVPREAICQVELRGAELLFSTAANDGVDAVGAHHQISVRELIQIFHAPAVMDTDAGVGTEQFKNFDQAKPRGGPPITSAVDEYRFARVCDDAVSAHEGCRHDGFEGRPM